MIENKIKSLITRSIEESGLAEIGIEPNIERPSNSDFGDYATNVALELGSRLERNPSSIADDIKEDLQGELFEEISVDGPGFINFTLSRGFVNRSLHQVLRQGKDFFTSEKGKNRKIQIEFVSSNPTGPLTVGHGRQAVLGDVLASSFEALGYDVSREYYFNDEGGQVKRLARTIWVRYMQSLGYEEEIPEEGYQGDYLKEVGKEVAEKNGEEFTRYSESTEEFFKERGLEEMIARIEEDLADLGVNFDNWFRESSLHESGEVEATLEKLKKAGVTYEKEGATWLESSSFGSPKDAVLVKSNGDPTYLLPDIAYHLDKKERSFRQAIVVLGADHHRHAKNLNAALEALDFDSDFYRALLHQFVSLKKGEEVESMSTREGEFITLKEFTDDLGKDVVRYFMAARKPESHLEFDYKLAKEESMDNPVYYVQYAHTRIASIFREAELSVDELDCGLEDLNPLVEEKEKELIVMLDRLPGVIESAAEDFNPHVLCKKAEDLAASFHKYYNSYRIICEDEDLSRARLLLCLGVKKALEKLLETIGVSAPERM